MKKFVKIGVILLVVSVLTLYAFASTTKVTNDWSSEAIAERALKTETIREDFSVLIDAIITKDKGKTIKVLIDILPDCVTITERCMANSNEPIKELKTYSGKYSRELDIMLSGDVLKKDFALLVDAMVSKSASRVMETLIKISPDFVEQFEVAAKSLGDK